MNRKTQLALATTIAGVALVLTPVRIRPGFDTVRDSEVRWLGPAQDGHPSSPTTVPDPSTTCPTFC